MAAKRIYIVCDKSKECVKKFKRGPFAWDSGLVTALVPDLPTRTRVGTQCPGSTWKKYHPHRLKTHLLEGTTRKFKIKPLWCKLE